MRKALILLSGGQDSATCLSFAKREFDEIYTLAFNYGQRHQRELMCSAKLSKIAGARLHFVLMVPTLQQLGGSALVEADTKIDTPHQKNKDLPASFVPGRNYIFLGFAAAKAFQLDIHDIVTGVCQTDYSGYPDCRHESIKAIETALAFCLDYDITIHTPLMNINKAQTVKEMKILGTLDWYKYTHTCYEGQYPPCGKCPACILRAKGFEEAGIHDPLMED